MQQFRAGFEAEVAAAAMSAAGCGMQFVLPNRTPLPATREAGLVQIAISGQCLPAMGRVKLLRVVGQLGYCIANPMIWGRARISALIGVCRNAQWIPEIEGSHEQPGGIPSFCQRVCRQTAAGINTSEGRKSN